MWRIAPAVVGLWAVCAAGCVAGCGTAPPRSGGPARPLPAALASSRPGGGVLHPPVQRSDPAGDSAVLAAARAYVAALQTAYRSGSPEAFFQLTAPTCPCRTGVLRVCADLVRAAERTDITLVAVDPRIAARDADHADVLMTLHNPPYDIYPVAGSAADRAASTAPAGYSPEQVSFDLVGGRWIAFYVGSRS